MRQIRCDVKGCNSAATHTFPVPNNQVRVVCFPHSDTYLEVSRVDLTVPDKGEPTRADLEEEVRRLREANGLLERQTATAQSRLSTKYAELEDEKSKHDGTTQVLAFTLQQLGMKVVEIELGVAGKSHA